MNAATYNKAIAAFIGGVVQLLNLWIDVSWISQDVVATLAAAGTVVAVWFFRNA